MTSWKKACANLLDVKPKAINASCLHTFFCTSHWLYTFGLNFDLLITCLWPLWWARVTTLILVSEHSIENHSITVQFWHVGLINTFAITFLQGLTEALISVDGVNRRLAIASRWLGSVLLSRVRLPSSCSTRVALLNEESNASWIDNLVDYLTLPMYS